MSGSRGAGGTFRLAAAGLVAAALLVSAGCGRHREVRPAPAPAAMPAGPKVAVAPLENQSNDLSASDIVRDAFVEGVSRRGYAVVPVAESDKALREALGISYGGQLPTATPQEVCAALGVEGVFYGEVLEFSKTTTGIYNSVTAAASFKLYRKDGTLAWQGGDRQVHRDTPRGGSAAGLGAEIIGRAVGNLLLNPMTPYARRVGANAAAKVPPDALAAAGK
ncbi:MAG: DUF799 family lipoprotein [Deltaproteobacteria bacterium]|nr:DUF799 family lipoprotein [Deltaproteobacteria bacterium]